MQTPIEYPSTSDTPTSRLPFSPAVRDGDLIFVSGQDLACSTSPNASDDGLVIGHSNAGEVSAK